MLKVCVDNGIFVCVEKKSNFAQIFYHVNLCNLSEYEL